MQKVPYISWEKFVDNQYHLRIKIFADCIFVLATPYRQYNIREQYFCTQQQICEIRENVLPRNKQYKGPFHYRYMYMCGASYGCSVTLL